jgi:hypothetical protein
MARLQVAFFHGRTWNLFAQAIRLWTWSKFNHCEVVFPPHGSLRADTSEGVLWCRPPVGLPGWETWELEVTEEQLAKARDFANAEIGCRYDWKGVFLAQFLPLRREDPDRWFCSEISAALLIAAGQSIAGPPCGYSPASLRTKLAKTPQFKQI